MSLATPFPLQWPVGRPRKPAAQRRASRFNHKESAYRDFGDGKGYAYKETKDLTIAGAIKRLQDELDRIGARLPVVSSNIEVKLDGTPYSNRRVPDDPGVAVYFQLAGESHCLPCDTYTTVAANIAAIAAHIKATRDQERHGVATAREMFRGFTQLEAPGDKWWDVLQCRPDAPRETIEAQFRRLMKDRHPDAGGTVEAMTALNKARAEALKSRAA